ncbi:hypothetical protein U8527_08440 [Kordia algicida OT-1]|uniref:Lipid/polyisoprenoid-binding YceI-like domain-containing protein n=1 Tax=Kordia algicida OT-1 TaxID=391587 RepID=A9E6J5_9FLAO|nr:hypothetical protein [Kordia algicida]EDP95043.1 hypothetical protein KAOT1_01869 [Kordia algicida OT-1]
MKKLLLTLLFCCITFTLFAQTKIYRGDSTNLSDLLFTVQDGKVYKSNISRFSDRVLFTINDNTIMEGNSTSVFDVIATVREGKVYKERSFTTFDVMFNIYKEKIYDEDSQFIFDVKATIRNGKVYKERSMMRSDILLTIEGELTDIELAAVWLAF